MIKRFSNYIISSDNDYENENKKEAKDITNNKPLNEEKKNLENKNDKINNKSQSFKENKNIKNSNKKNLDESDDNDEDNKINIKKVIYCEICDKRLESNQDYLLHMSSKKHKYKMKELLKKELKECGSVRKLLIKEKMIAPCKRWRINNARYLLYGFALNRYLNN